MRRYAICGLFALLAGKGVAAERPAPGDAPPPLAGSATIASAEIVAPPGAAGPSSDAAVAVTSTDAAAAPGGAGSPSPAPAATAPANAAGATGSPSEAAATVSPASVASAVMRADEAEGQSSRFGISLGTSFAGGNFGSGQGSRIWSTALGARYAIGTLRLTASIPYLHIRSRGLIFSGVDSTPIIVAGGSRGPRVTNDGLGDVTLGAAFTLPTGDDMPEIELSGRVKLPTARDSDQLSTGKTDYSAGVQVSKTVGRFAPFVSATYRIFGDPARINLRDGFAASAGTSVAIGDRSIILVSYHYAQAASRLVRDSHELFAGASTRLPGSPFRFTGFATAGISSGAAAGSGGLSLSFDF